MLVLPAGRMFSLFKQEKETYPSAVSSPNSSSVGYVVL